MDLRSLHEVATITDPIERARVLTRLMTDDLGLTDAAARYRRHAIAEARDQGHTKGADCSCTRSDAAPDHPISKGPAAKAPEPLAVLNVQDRAVATSGMYERGPHIWDGRGGDRPAALTSVTVIADSLTTADVLATTVIVLGPDGVRWAAETYGCAVLALDGQGRLHLGGPLRHFLAS